MTTIKFQNGTELTAKKIGGGGRHWQGASRDVLTIELAEDAATFEQLKEAFSAANCEAITLSDGTRESLHEHYTLRVGLALRDVVITPATAEAAEVTETRWVVEMAQKTYAERLMEQQAAATEALAAQNAMIEDCIAEMAGIVYA